MPLIQGNAKSADAAGDFYSHPIDQSLRFNDDDSAYLSWTPASAGNRKTWTWSGWVKLSELAQQDLFTAGTDSSNWTSLYYDSSKQRLTLLNFVSGAAIHFHRVSPYYRDPSAWYHVVVAMDTTQATAVDRVKFYVNGVQQTDYATSTIPQNYEGYINTTNEHRVGGGYYGSHDGYLAEVNFIDGTALDADSFGEFKSGVWIPKAYSGSYGTNGFYLDFGNSGSIGADVSGNGNNWTANNLAATDVVLDSPTNNFATLNPLDMKVASSGELGEGNLAYLVGGTGGSSISRATIGASSGKWYFETIPLTDLRFSHFGVLNVEEEINLSQTGASSTGWDFYSYAGEKTNNNVGTSYGTSVSVGDVCMCAFDMDAGKIWFGLNGTWFDSSNPATGTSAAFTNLSGTVAPAVGCSSTYSAKVYANFGQDSSFAGNKTAQGNTDANGIGDFYYAPPSGYLALCTANLPDPVESIDPAQDGSPQDHFNTVLWTGDGSQTRSISGVGFQPDFTWMKSRNIVQEHQLYDAVRGAGGGKMLCSNQTAAEGQDGSGNSDSQYGYLSSFDSDGFSVNDGSVATTGGWVNFSGRTYAAWNWKANGSGTSIAVDAYGSGVPSIASTVSANTDAGFSIVSWEPEATAGTVGHGLTQKPEFIIMKDRDANILWLVYHEAAGTQGYLSLNTTGGFSSNSTTFTTAPTNDVFDPGSGLVTGNSYTNMIGYCFHSVEGFSKFGSYTGNGSSDGTFVYTGFRPAFILWKRTDGSVYFWGIKDTARSPYNVSSEVLFPNATHAEATNMSCDFLSNGFKWRSNQTSENDSGATYIYMAFAENPFKYANAR